MYIFCFKYIICQIYCIIYNNSHYSFLKESPLDSMARITGGQSYCITSQKSLHQSLESLVQRCQSGVVVVFEKIGPDPTPINGNLDDTKDSKAPPSSVASAPTRPPVIEPPPVVHAPIPTPVFTPSNTPPFSPKHTPPFIPSYNPAQTPLLYSPDSKSPPSSVPWKKGRHLIYVVRSGAKGIAQGHWPLPEAFWPDNTFQSLPPRHAHPVISFSCGGVELVNQVDQLPFDKYELEPSALTRYILERRQPHILWQVNSNCSNIAHLCMRR